MSSVESSPALASLLVSPFVSSFVGQAREGDLHDPDQMRRAAAWARWAVSSLDEFRGHSEREYFGLRLAGEFYDPLGSGPLVRPHLEVPSRVLDRPDAEFPLRLAQMGNALLFPWWLKSEVTAAKRSLFNTPKGSVAAFVEEAAAHRQGLVDQVLLLNSQAAMSWEVVERMLVGSPGDLVGFATGDVLPDELAEVFPPAKKFDLELVFDAQLRDSNGQWAARRLGMWQFRGGYDGSLFALGVGTPRLTPNSLFSDPLFMPARESAASLLARAVVLRRIVSGLLQEPIPGAVRADTSEVPVGVFLRAVVARVGARLPEASVDAAVNFLQVYPDGKNAWSALQQWSESGYLLTVSEEAFLAAHENALRFIRRADSPARDDINTILPLAWDGRNRVVRATFSRSHDPS